MKWSRWIGVAVFGIVGIATIGSVPQADTSAVEPLLLDHVGATQLRLAADRRFGYAPMTVNLSGMMQTAEGDLIPMAAGGSVRFVVDSPFLTVGNSTTETSLLDDLHYESISPGPATASAFHRSVEIRRPGRYRFRVQVLGQDGRVVSSNEVAVRAL